MKIPKEFKLFANTINVEFDEQRMNDKNLLGESSLPESKITLTTTIKEGEISEDQIQSSFYHEKTHMILDTMGEHELSRNEKFVEIFSQLLRQSDETVKY